ncbi:MAG: hypothetical protein LC751_19960 [Actinobacteria bacterium]|nr:hypothetical protein [Actinomycetota bacterium]
MKRKENSSHIIYTPRSDATLEDEARTLAEVYSFILQVSEEKRKDACTSAPDDARKDYDNAHTAESILP